jgi:hypothetical protein
LRNIDHGDNSRDLTAATVKFWTPSSERELAVFEALVPLGVMDGTAPGAESDALMACGALGDICSWARQGDPDAKTIATMTSNIDPQCPRASLVRSAKRPFHFIFNNPCVSREY